MIHLVWAQDELLAEEQTDELLPSGPEVLTFAADETDTAALMEALRAPSLFGPDRVVVVRHAEHLNAAAVDALAEALQGEIVPQVVVVSAVTDREPKRLVKTLGEIAEVHRLRTPRRRELISWVEGRMKAYGLTPGAGAANTFVEAVGSGLRDLDHAIAQIATRAGKKAKVEREHVLAHFRGASEKPIWELFDALVKRDTKEAFSVLRALLDHGDDPIPIVFALVSQARAIMRAKGLLDRSGPLTDDDLAHALGVSRGRAAVVSRQAARIGWEWLLELYDVCAEADVELKGGEDGAVLPPEIVLERLVGRITGADQSAVRA